MADIMVICTRCNTPVLVTPPENGSMWPTYHWHTPCRKCGGTNFGAIEPHRYFEKYDIKE